MSFRVWFLKSHEFPVSTYMKMRFRKGACLPLLRAGLLEEGRHRSLLQGSSFMWQMGSPRTSLISTFKTMMPVMSPNINDNWRNYYSQTTSCPHKSRRWHILLKFNFVCPTMLLGIYPGSSLDFTEWHLLPLLRAVGIVCAYSWWVSK